MAETVEALKAKGRQALIDQAVEILKRRDADLDPAPFDQVRVRANDSQIWVSFATSIVFLAEGTRYTGSVGVELVSGSSSRSPLSHASDTPSSRTPPCFVPDANAAAAIAFVLAAVNRSDEVGSLPDGKMPPGRRMVIRDKGDHYAVSVTDEWMESSYHVDRTKGVISNAMHAHMAVEELPESEQLHEITEEEGASP